MTAALDDLGRSLTRGQPALAFEIRCALERFGAEPTWPAEELLSSLKNPLGFFASIDPRGPREQAYRLLPDCRGDWRDVLERRFLLETDTKAIGTIVEMIDQELLLRCAARAQVQPHRTPAAFTWLAEGAAADPALREGRQNRLLNLLIQALRHEAFAPFRLRLKALFDSGGTVPKLLPELTLDEARQAEASIRHAALEDYRREPLLAALHLKFPDLLADQDTDDDLYALPASIAAKRDRLRELVEEELPANRRAIEEARALGDLRENFEYKSARQRHEYLTSPGHRTAAGPATLDADRPRRRGLRQAPHRQPGDLRVGKRQAARSGHPRPLGERARARHHLVRVRPRPQIAGLRAGRQGRHGRRDLHAPGDREPAGRQSGAEVGTSSRVCSRRV